MYNVHLPIMLESERQAVYREERKKERVLNLCWSVNMWFPDTANGFFQQKEGPKLSQEFKTRVDSIYKYAIIPEIVT